MIGVQVIRKGDNKEFTAIYASDGKGNMRYFIPDLQSKPFSDKKFDKLFKIKLNTIYL